MLHGNHRNIETDHCACLAGKVAARTNHMFAIDHTLVRRHRPSTTGQLCQGSHRIVSINFGTQRTRARRQCLSQICRLNISIIRMLNGTQQSVGSAQRPDGLHLIRRQETDINSDRASHPSVIPIFIQAIFAHRKANIGHLPKTDRVTGLLFQTLIEVD